MPQLRSICRMNSISSSVRPAARLQTRSSWLRSIAETTPATMSSM